MPVFQLTCSKILGSVHVGMKKILFKKNVFSLFLQGTHSDLNSDCSKMAKTTLGQAQNNLRVGTKNQGQQGQQKHMSFYFLRNLSTVNYDCFITRGTIYMKAIVSLYSVTNLYLTNDYNICICCFYALHAALREKSKIWLAQNQDNVSEQGYMSICKWLFQCTIKLQLSVLVQYKADIIIISLKINLFSP